MKKFFSVLLWLFFTPFGTVQAQCLEYRTHSFNDNFTNWYSSKQDACTASAEAYQNKINETHPCVNDYVGTLSLDGAICQRRGTITCASGQGGASPQDVGWFQERSCQFKPEETSCSVGNPTLPGLGTKTHTEPIYTSTFAAPLSFELSYRSAYSGRSMLLAGTWLHTFSSRLQFDYLVADVHALAADGSVVRFAKGTTTDAWVSTESGDTLNRTPAIDPTAVVWELQRQRDNTRETYDHTGKLLKITARNGWVTTLIYNDSGQLQSVSNAFGRQLGFTWDANGFLATLTAPGGDITRYAHDAQGNLLTVTWPDGNIKRYHYEDGRFPRALTGITDETGQRIGSYTYDAQGRVSETQRASGVDRLQFSYSQDASGAPQTTITDFSSGTPTTRTHSFALQGRVLRPAGANAPCPLCGSTAQAITYDEAGRKLRELQHDGSVVFYKHNERGLETERATFPTSFATATTRPGLARATSVVSTQWHATWSLPRTIAEPGRITEYTHNQRGITSLTTRSTTDTTGAAKFTATPTGPVSTTEYAYNANHLNTRITELTDGVPTQQWNLAYNELGDLTRVTDVTKAQSARITQYTADGRVLRGTTDQGVAIAVTYSLRGAITQITRGTQTVRFAYNLVGSLIQVRTPDNQLIDYVLDSKQAVVDIKLNGASVSAQMLALGDYPDSTFKAQVEAAKQTLIQSVEGLLRAAHAQVVVIGGGRSPQPPVFDPRTDMLMSPMSGPDKAIRAIQEAIARACHCDPNQGFDAPKFTAVTFSHVFYGGHMTPMFSDQSYFAPTEKVGQALVDAVISRATPSDKLPVGTRDVYNVNMGRVVGVRYDKDSASSNNLVPTQWVTMVVERNNCSSTWRFNEVVTIYPDRQRP